LSQLKKLTEKGWWTVGSQPAVNGVSSSDPVFGWGPRAGYVFQKCFVEFFCTEEDLDVIEKLVARIGEGWVHYFACNNEVSYLPRQPKFRFSQLSHSQGDLRTNVPDVDRNAVTWGIFPAKEIVQTTIIERESFLSWKVYPI